MQRTGRNRPLSNRREKQNASPPQEQPAPSPEVQDINTLFAETRKLDKELYQKIGALKAQHGQTMNEINAVDSKAQNFQRQELKKLSSTFTSEAASLNRIIRTNFPGAVQPIESSTERLRQEIEEFEAEINKSLRRIKRSTNQLQEKSNELEEQFNEFNSNDLADMRHRVNKFRTLGHNLQSRINELVDETKKNAILVEPIKNCHTRAKALFRYEVDNIFRTHVDRHLQIVNDYKIDFLERIHALLSPYLPPSDLEFIVPFFRRCIESGRMIASAQQDLSDRIDELEQYTYDIAGVLADMMAPDVDSDDQFTFVTLRNEWERFANNNRRVQRRVNRELEGLGFDEEDVIRRIGLLEKQIEWCIGRIRVWDTETRAMIFQETEYDEELRNAEEALDLLDDFLGDDDEKRKKLKMPPAEPLPPIQRFPNPKITIRPRIRFDLPEELPLTYENYDQHIRYLRHQRRRKVKVEIVGVKEEKPYYGLTVGKMKDYGE